MVGDKNLSIHAHNVKVITPNGQVTLRGPFRSEHEKPSVELKAAAVAGKGRVSGYIDVVPAK